MAMLADLVELVIGVDTHKHTHTAAVVMAPTGQTLATVTVQATPVGYQRLLQLVARPPGRTGLGDREHRWVRRRPNPVPACSCRAGRGTGSAQAGRPPPRRQV
jgi:hypothetical protein